MSDKNAKPTTSLKEGLVVSSIEYTMQEDGGEEQTFSTLYNFEGEGIAMQFDDHVANLYRMCRVSKATTAAYFCEPTQDDPNHRNLIARFKWSEQHQLPLYDFAPHQERFDREMAFLKK